MGLRTLTCRAVKLRSSGHHILYQSRRNYETCRLSLCTLSDLPDARRIQCQNTEHLYRTPRPLSKRNCSNNNWHPKAISPAEMTRRQPLVKVPSLADELRESPKSGTVPETTSCLRGGYLCRRNFSRLVQNDCP